MSAALHFDEATWRRAEATYKTPDPVEQRRIVYAALGLKPGQDANLGGIRRSLPGRVLNSRTVAIRQ